MADQLTFSLLAWQRKLLADKTRFKIVVAGRRCGKSRYAIVSTIIKGLECPDPTGSILYIAPTQSMARVLCWDLLNDLGRSVIASANISNSEIKLINGVKVYVRGADHPDSLRGMKLYYVIIDEAATVKDDVFPAIVRPALSDMKGGALIIGTPVAGESWFKELYDVGVDGKDPEWMSLQLTTYDNELIDKNEIANAKKTLSEAMFKQEYMASFESMAQGIVNMNELRVWGTDTPLPVFNYIIQSADTAFTEKTSNDPTAFTAWGVFVHKDRKHVMLLDAWTEHLQYPQLREKLIEEWHSLYGRDDTRKGKRADVILIEAKASGLSIMQDLRQANLPVIPYNPGNADKVNRMHQAAPMIELGCVWVPESNKDKGKIVTWAREWYAQMKAFPHVKHDDYVDSTSQVMIYLRDSGLLELDQAEIEIEEYEIDYGEKRRSRTYSNPYAC